MFNIEDVITKLQKTTKTRPRVVGEEGLKTIPSLPERSEDSRARMDEIIQGGRVSTSSSGNVRRPVTPVDAPKKGDFPEVEKAEAEAEKARKEKMAGRMKAGLDTIKGALETRPTGPSTTSLATHAGASNQIPIPEQRKWSKYTG
jgi:hypothetical protein